MNWDEVKSVNITEELILCRLKDIAEKLGHFPKQKELGDIKEWKLINAIIKINRPLSYLAEKIGYKTKQLPRNYWTESKIIETLGNLQTELGHVPSYRELVKMNLRTLANVIYKDGKSMLYYKEFLNETSPIKWNEEKALEELKQLAESFGRFPTTAELCERGYSGLVGYIHKNGFSIHDYAIKLGYETTQKPKGYWKDFENIKKELQAIIDKNNDKFPTQEMIRSNIGSSILFAIYEYHKSIVEVAEKMGYEIDSYFKTSDGHYVQSSNEYLLDEFLYSRGIKHEVGGLISDKHLYLYDFKVKDFYIEIWGYEENRENNKICERYKKKREKKETLYKELGLNLISIESDVFKKSFEEIERYFIDLFSGLGFLVDKKVCDYDIVNSAKHCRFWSEAKIETYLKEIISKINHFPTSLELLQMNEGGLADAIKRFGGSNYFRTKMGYDIVKQSNNYWNDDTIIKEIKLVIDQLGHFPVHLELKSLKKYDLIRAINRGGGYIKFQELMGYKPQVKPKGYYTKEVMLKELSELRDKLGKIPTYSETRKENKTLCSAIDRSKLGFKNLVSELN